MMDKLLKKSGVEISRRDVLTGAGKLAAGAALVSAGGLTVFSNAEAVKSGKKYPWPYKKLDPKRAADIAYENWYKGFCAYAVTSAILGQLQEKVGKPYTYLPIEAFSFGHGGTVGWGTLCGTLFGAGIATSFAAGKDGEKILNDVMAWYSDTKLPIYAPSKPRTAVKKTNAAGSPLCHVSVGKWMEKEGVKFFSAGRKERCARLSADVAVKTVQLLNAYADGKYKPAHGSQAKMHQMTTQNNCTDCHGSSVPKVPGL
jgi:hypothetical protein